ncbi:MAG: NAD(P)-dependent oxidoreductase [Phycisphaerae bacterium]|nr:NAD(P)-dependent oxidoreductase [Phycisphaerae bacterium]
MESETKRVFVTGGSGFIGTNLIARLRDEGRLVLNADAQPPRNPAQKELYRQVDILDSEALKNALVEFAPTHVVHLAARTDLDGKTPDEYRVNTEGTRNLIRALAATPTVRRTIFTSTKLVCESGHSPRDEEDFCPDTAYGRSKAQMEQMIRSEAKEGDLACSWCIARPTSIWGPWYSIPYHAFLLSVARGRYVHPGRRNPPRSFGYVENYAFQTLKLLEAPAEAVQGKVFYLSDYDEFTIRAWAEAVAAATGGKRIRTIPAGLMRLLAATGDVCKFLGWKTVPISSFRLRNMWADTTGIPLENTRALTGPLPFTMRDGVRRTVEWMRREGVIP